MSEKRYPEEFKIEAVKQVTAASNGAYDLAERLERPQIVSIVGAGVRVTV